MSASEQAGLSQQLKMFLSTKEIMEGGWNRRGGGIFPKLAESVDRKTVESEDFRDKLLPVEYEEFPDANAPKYHERGTHGQKVPDPHGPQSHHKQTRPTQPYEAAKSDQRRGRDSDAGFAPDATPDERGLLQPEPTKKRVRDQKNRRGQSSERSHREDEKIADARAPDAFDSAVQQLGDVTKVAAEMRSQGMEDWVIEERLLRELSTRSLILEPQMKETYIEGITWEDIESTGDRHKLKDRVRDRRRRANWAPEQREAFRVSAKKREAERRTNRTPEQREEYLASERNRDAKRSADRTPEQREHRRATLREQEAERRTNRTPEQREKDNAAKRARYAKSRAAKKQEAREATGDDLEAPE